MSFIVFKEYEQLKIFGTVVFRMQEVFEQLCSKVDIGKDAFKTVNLINESSLYDILDGCTPISFEHNGKDFKDFMG